MTINFCEDFTKGNDFFDLLQPRIVGLYILHHFFFIYIYSNAPLYIFGYFFKLKKVLSIQRERDRCSPGATFLLTMPSHKSVERFVIAISTY